MAESNYSDSISSQVTLYPPSMQSGRSTSHTRVSIHCRPAYLPFLTWSSRLVALSGTSPLPGELAAAIAPGLTLSLAPLFEHPWGLDHMAKPVKGSSSPLFSLVINIIELRRP
jgi:hypothetical protein